MVPNTVTDQKSDYFHKTMFSLYLLQSAFGKFTVIFKAESQVVTMCHVRSLHSLLSYLCIIIIFVSQHYKVIASKSS